MSDKLQKELVAAIKRIERLEKAVFASSPRVSGKTRPTNFKGAKGGIMMLASKGYFDAKRTARQVMEKLGSSGYHYRIQVVQTTLNRLSGTRGPLTALPIAGHKVYVNRK